MAGSGSTVYDLNSFSRVRPLSLSVYKQNRRHLPPSTSCCSGRRSLFSSASAASYSSFCRSFGSFGANTDLFDIQSLRQQKKRNCTVLAMSEAGRSDLASFTDEEWKKRLTPEQFYVTRQKGTERAFTGVYWNTKIPGTYHCVCCDTPLFESSTKFDSGTGWPSYYQPLGNNVKTKLDLSIFFMPRQEVICAVCEAHLGHVFNDGPPPTGKRYCINSAALKLKPRQ